MVEKSNEDQLGLNERGREDHSPSSSYLDLAFALSRPFTTCPVLEYST